MAKGKYLLGYDVGSSSIKASLVEVDSGVVINSATSPRDEMAMEAKKEGWAEQDPAMWWENLVAATREILANEGQEYSKDIAGIGIAYQMHGLVLVDKNRQVLRPSIIWCDSRAVDIGNKAFQEMGEEHCLGHYLNSPGNFTASKIKWVLDHEPHIYEKAYKAMLPGDYIAMQLTGQINTTVSGLSEGIMWDFKNQQPAEKLLKHLGIDPSLIPDLVPTFGDQGKVNARAAAELGIQEGTPVAYRAGDQPNNAFSLNVLEPGEVATTAGTSGVIYGINEKVNYDPKSRVNTFVHVNHKQDKPRYGILACINGTGILNNWLKHQLMPAGLDYDGMNEIAAQSPAGAKGVRVLPFGNGAERPLENKVVDAHFHGIKFTTHERAHLLRASQEGIVFALNYGMDIMQQMGMNIKTVKAGAANMFLSPVFREVFASVTGATLELYNTDGAQGAARGAGVGAGIYNNFKEAFNGLKKIQEVDPDPSLKSTYQDIYDHWCKILKQYL